jgi:hypothetical protein
MTISTPLTLNGVVFNRINNDKYSSEWFARSSTGEYSLVIAHSKEPKLQSNGYTTDRHLVKFRKTVYATDTVPEYWFESYFVIRVPGPHVLTSGVDTALTTTIKALIDGQTITAHTFMTDVMDWQV